MAEKLYESTVGEHSRKNYFSQRNFPEKGKFYKIKERNIGETYLIHGKE
jgi:hypothetical protein